MKLHLYNIDLERIRESALYKLKNSSNSCIEADIWPTLCIIEAFVNHLNRPDTEIGVTTKANTRLELSYLKPVVVQCSDPEFDPELHHLVVDPDKGPKEKK